MTRLHNRYRFRVMMILLVLLLATAGMMSSCGKKGPLYMPGQEQPKSK